VAKGIPLKIFTCPLESVFPEINPPSTKIESMESVVGLSVFPQEKKRKPIAAMSRNGLFNIN
jgi:hypothetical protein